MLPFKTDLDTKVTLETDTRNLAEEPSFHILFLGDWSGNLNAVDIPASANRRPIEIDRDNFDSVMRKLNVAVNLTFPDVHKSTLTLQFAALEDFHPDNIFQRMPLFSALRDIRHRLINSKTFESAAREVRSWFSNSGNDSITSAEQSVSIPTTSQVSSDNLLDQILGQATNDNPTSQTQNTQLSELDIFVKNIVKPHLIKIDADEQSQLLTVVDEVISDLMRNILHHPQFQSLESAWRGVYFFVKKIETDSFSKVFLMDIDKTEFSVKLKTISGLAMSDAYKSVLNDHNYDHFGLICGNYDFSLNVEDAATLFRSAEFFQKINIPFVSYIKPEIFGFSSFRGVDSSDSLKLLQDSNEEKLWNMLRVAPESEYIGLAVSRILTRLPYGENTEPAETFQFEEFTDAFSHENYLWSNPCFIIALLLSQTFQKHGLQITGNLFQTIEGLPLHLYSENGESVSKPCGETFMTQNNYERIAEQGFIPLVSPKNSDIVRLGILQSIAYPNSALKGRWY